MHSSEQAKVWLVSVNMGYGHQRAANPLVSLARDSRVITANDYPDIPKEDRKVWEKSERFYNFVSRAKSWPVLGELIFRLFDKFQDIAPFYPRVRETALSWQLKFLMRQIKKGWGRHLVEKLLREPLPILTTYFAVAHMAEYWNYPAPIYLVVTDSDIPRVWAPSEPERSKIVYFASSIRSKERLLSYGVSEERVVLTNFPLNDTLFTETAVLESLRRRLKSLDPKNRYLKQVSGAGLEAVKKGSKKKNIPVVTVAIGGAGAQMDIVRDIVKSLSSPIKQNKIKLNLVAGVSEAVADKCNKLIHRYGLENSLNEGVRIVSSENRSEYFRSFDELMLETDVLWTKPSELTFYTALGLPLLMMPPVGAHERENRDWLIRLGAAVDQFEPSSAQEWLLEMIEEGILSRAALSGYLGMSRDGAQNIKKTITKLKNKI